MSFLWGGGGSASAVDSFLNPSEEYTGTKKLLLVVNPASGNKRAGEVFSSVVAPLCQRHGIEYEVVWTVVDLFKDPARVADTFAALERKKIKTQTRCSACSRRKEDYQSAESNRENVSVAEQRGSTKTGSVGSTGADVGKTAVKNESSRRAGQALEEVDAKVTSINAANKGFIDVFKHLHETDRLLGIVFLSGDGTLYELINFLSRGEAGGAVDVTKLRLGIVPCGTSDGLASSIFDRRKEEQEFRVLRQVQNGVPRLTTNVNTSGLLDAAGRAGTSSTRQGGGSLSLQSSSTNSSASSSEALSAPAFSNSTFGCPLALSRYVFALIVYSILKDETHPIDAYKATMRLLANTGTTSSYRKKDKILAESSPSSSTIDFHHTCYGIVSDIDLENEDPDGWVRHLPKGVRNTLVPVKHILGMRQVRCKVKIFNESGEVTEHSGDDFVFASVLNCNYIDPTLILAPGARYNDGLLHVVCCRGQVSRIKAIQVFGEIETGEHLTQSPEVCLYFRAKKVEITVPGGPGASILDVCGNGEFPFENCNPDDSRDRQLTCEILPGYLRFMLPTKLFAPVTEIATMWSTEGKK